MAAHDGEPVQLHRLQPPQLPTGYVERAPLTARILATEPGGVCVVSAAPGYGATTALAGALAAGSDAVSWVRLDDRCDDHEARRHLVAALAGVVPSPGEAPGMPWPSSPAPSASPMWLVVDGLDPERHPGCLEDLVHRARHLPATTRLAACSHTRVPGLELAAGARAVALDEADLRFDADESVQLLQALHPGIDIEVSTAILAAAEGWPTALVAAANRARDRNDPDWLGRGGADDLFQDWWAVLPDPARRFLTETAVLDLLSAGPADAVTGRHDGASLLKDLDARRAFIFDVPAPDGHQGRWWSRHGLLTQHLRNSAGTEWPQRHVLAAAWFEAAGDVAQTMHHLMETGRSRDAGAYLIAHESDLITAGHADKVLQWYDRLPTELGPRATHLLRIGWGQVLSGDLRGADATAAQVEADLGASRLADDESAGPDTAEPDSRDVPVEGEAALLRAYLASFHADPATMISASGTAVAELAGRGPTDSGQLAPLLVVRGLLWSGQPEAAQRALDRCGDRPFTTPMIRESHLAGARALVAAANGSILQARAWSEAALQWLQRQGIDPLAVLQHGPLVARGIAHLENGELTTAHATAATVAATAERNGQTGEAVSALMLAARVEAVRGDIGAALRTLARARDLACTATPATSMVVPLDQLQARVRASAGDLVRARRLVRSLPASDTRSLLLARVALLHQPVAARRTLEALQPATPRTIAERHLLLACSYLTSSRRIAEGHLRKAASTAVENGLGMLLADSDATVLALAEDTALHHQDDAVAWLLRRRRDARATPRDPSGAQEPSTAPALSRGELQLLALLPSRASNSDIADTLGVSINTIKTRLRRLYAKLGVASRDEAVERAVSLGVNQPV